MGHSTLLVATLLSTLFLTISQSSKVCSPAQWEGLLAGKIAWYDTNTQRAGLMYTEIYYHYDSINKKVFHDEYVSNDLNNTLNMHIQVFDFYGQGFRYTAYPKGLQCLKTPLSTHTMNRCLPDDAVLQGRYVIGGRPADSYEYSVAPTASSDGYTVDITMRSSPVTPMFETITMFSKGVYSISAFNIANVTSGIHDATVFNLPSYCSTPTIGPISARRRRATQLHF